MNPATNKTIDRRQRNQNYNAKEASNAIKTWKLEVILICNNLKSKVVEKELKIVVNRLKPEEAITNIAISS